MTKPKIKENLNKERELIICQWRVYEFLRDNDMLSEKQKVHFIKDMQLNSRECLDIAFEEGIILDIDASVLAAVFDDLNFVKEKFNGREEYIINEELLDEISLDGLIKIGDEMDKEGKVYSVFIKGIEND